MSSSQLLFVPPPQDAAGLPVGPETVVKGDRQTSALVVSLTYTCFSHKLMRCAHCWGLLANTRALVCIHINTHLIAHRDTQTNTTVH